MRIRERRVKRNVFMKNNMTRNIKFSYMRIITTITFLTIFITNKNTYGRMKREITTFYLWTKNISSRTTNFQRRVIRDINL
jgi:hypothetical protein